METNEHYIIMYENEIAPPEIKKEEIHL